MQTPNDFSNTVTAVVIILVFFLAYLAVKLKEKPKKRAEPLVPYNKALQEMTDIIDAATDYTHMNQIPALIANFRQTYKKRLSADDINYYMGQIEEDKHNRIIDIVREKNMQVIRAKATA